MNINRDNNAYLKVGEKVICTQDVTFSDGTTGPFSQELKEHIKLFYSGEWGDGRDIWWKK